MCGSNGSSPGVGIERVVELGELGRAVGRLGVEIEIVPRDAVDQEPERPAVDRRQRVAQRGLAIVRRAEHQREMRADQLGLARMILRPQPAQRRVVGLAQQAARRRHRARQP